MWTYGLSGDCKSLIHKRLEGKDAIREWLRVALMTYRGEQPYLPDKYGIDYISINNSDDPAYFLQKSIEETCSLRKDIVLRDCQCWQEGLNLFATIVCETPYGDVTVDSMRVNVEG